MEPQDRREYVDPNSFASDPGNLTLSPAKLRLLLPSLFDGTEFPPDEAAKHIRFLEEHIRFGDSRAAVVICIDPLLVAAYSDELDCVAMLRFPRLFVTEYGLAVWSKLLTVNLYGNSAHEDLIPGPNQFHRFTAFHPLIAEFLSDDRERIEERKRGIGEEEWARTSTLGWEYLNNRPGIARDGRPFFSGQPATRKPPRRLSVSRIAVVTGLGVVSLVAAVLVGLTFGLAWGCAMGGMAIMSYIVFGRDYLRQG